MGAERPLQHTRDLLTYAILIALDTVGTNVVAGQEIFCIPRGDGSEEETRSEEHGLAVTLGVLDLRSLPPLSELSQKRLFVSTTVV